MDPQYSIIFFNIIRDFSQNYTAMPSSSLGSKCGSNNNSPLELRAGYLTHHALLLHGKKCMANKETYP